MICPRPRLAASLLLALAALATGPAPRAQAQAPAEPKAESTTPGIFFTVTEPITDAGIAQLKQALPPFLEEASKADEVARGRGMPILILEFQPGNVAPGRSTFGASHELAKYLAFRLNTTAKLKVRTVAYIPERLSGYAVMAALACDEIVMGPKATIGPIAPEDHDRADLATASTLLQQLVKRQGDREPFLGLFEGMLDRDIEVRRVQTADGSIRFVTAKELDAFKQQHATTDDQAAWEPGNRGVLKAEDFRGSLVKSLPVDRNDVKAQYNLSSIDELSSAEPVAHNPIELHGRIDSATEALVRYELSQAVKSGANRVFLYLDSEGGDEHAISNIINALADMPKSVVTIAFIEGRVTGRGALIPLACDQIVFHDKGEMGRIVDPNDAEDSTKGEPAKVAALSQFAEDTAVKKGHPRALAHAMVDAKAAMPGLNNNGNNGPLLLDSSEAVRLGLAVRVVGNRDALMDSYNIKDKPRTAQATWVHRLANTLNQPMVSSLLLFIGLFMMILELKLPGVGLPAIISALAFLLFFWSHYLGGTADQLEILLFLVGLVCLALELFVFPGFAVFGISGILLILVSVIMASHTFIWPTQEYEYRQMGQTLMQVTGAIITVSIGAVVVGRYFPSLPLFRRMILVPEPIGGPEDPTLKPSTSGDPGLFFLLGESGRTTTALKPTGKARFGEMLVDVTADGFFIEPDRLVEVIEVRGQRVIVKKI